VSVDPHRLTVNALAPSVRIEEAFVDGQPARRGAHNSFGPGSGALEFHFAGITLLEPHKARHRYRLEGFERSWVEAGARRDAYYTNIPPGHYRFRVQASNADGVWNEAGDTLELALAPHFYQTWWCYGALALAALGLVFSFHRMRMAEVHSRYAATFAERTRMARELHDSLLQGMSAAVMHLRGLRKRLASSPAETLAGDLKEVEGLLVSNVEETRRLVWDLRDDDPRLETALRRLVQRLAGGRAVEARVVVSGAERSVAPPVRHELIRIASEAVTNALDHAGAAHITVDLSYDGEGVRLTVSDDGRGFEPGQAPGAERGHFGLAGMRERAAALGAFTLDSHPGVGTRVQVEVKGHA
jgi:signal transduction histidine kinase